MISLIKKAFQLKLKYFAKFYIWRTKPYIIMIAGTANRHWIKENIVSSLNKAGFLCRGNKKNFNAEIGLPLSILGLEPADESEGIFSRWGKIILQGFAAAFYQKKNVDYLVLEMAIDQPDDMEYLLSIVRPQIAIFTTITMIYPENFSGLDEIAREFRKLLESLPKNGLAILNADDQRIHGLKPVARCLVVTYGIDNQNADYLAADILKILDGQTFQLCLPDMKTKRIKINRFGIHHIYAELVKNIILDNVKIKKV